MLWPLGLAVLLIALLVPIVIVALDRPRRGAAAPPADDGVSSGRLIGAVEELARQVVALEDDVDELRRALEAAREDVQALERRLDDPGPERRR